MKLQLKEVILQEQKSKKGKQLKLKDQMMQEVDNFKDALRQIPRKKESDSEKLYEFKAVVN